MSTPVVGDKIACVFSRGVRFGVVCNVYRSVIAFDFYDSEGRSTYVTYLQNEGVEWIRGVGTDEQRAALRVAYVLKCA